MTDTRDIAREALELAPKHRTMTLVFDIDVTKKKRNPLTTETPFGMAHACAVGDALERADVLLAAIEDIARNDAGKAGETARAALEKWSQLW